MDIKLPLNANPQLAVNKAGGDGLNLKMHQLLEAKVVDTQIMLNTLALKVADKTLTVRTEQPLTLQSGQTLQLQVVKLLPQPEFKILPPASPQTAQLAPPLALDNLILKLASQPASGTPDTTIKLSDLQTGQQLPASIISIANNKITLQLLPMPVNSGLPSTPATMTPANLLLTLDAKQILPPTTANHPTASAPLATSLATGTQLTLQVVKAGDKPTFTVLATPIDSERQIIEAFKQLLPIQASPAPLITHLQQALPELLTDASLAETLKNLAQKILSGIPARPQLTEPTQLKQAVNASGLFLESKLAELLAGRQDFSLQDDFKLKLSKLIHLLNQELAAETGNKSTENSETLKESLQKAQSAFAKLTLDQLNSLPKDDSPKQGWVLELPFFHNDAANSVKIEIERDKSGQSDDPQKNWAVSITITPPDLATIHCKISCYDGSVNTRFWSEAADTVEKINAHLDYLKQQFEQKGLTTGFMEAHQGLPAQTDSIKTPVPHLLSEKA
ncbi:flagellar hook-length control protein FliK [Methylomonas sp. LL1]|uniref:flagellar hook-length control protein FliK n=1 Tax=Methylomonas sp. LL1 TaxID=2785785 RepID=UPI0018C36E9C|nr:flagellar hook-length control protein FliK [Methylomonas sp. LL1]QPK61840.1 flagellar hook-length control protein FliK [Methylomonas sp. LL1]